MPGLPQCDYVLTSPANPETNCFNFVKRPEDSNFDNCPISCVSTTTVPGEDGVVATKTTVINGSESYVISYDLAIGEQVDG